MKPNSIAIFPVGGFGHAVAERLSAMSLETEIADVGGVLSNALAMARVVVLASWRPVPVLFERLDDACHAAGKPLAPVLLDGTILRVGPLVVPGSGPCWHCWVQRLEQHASRSDPRLRLREFYRTSPADAGPCGYLDAFALIAAARVFQLLQAWLTGAALPGNVWQIDMLTRVVATSTTVGIHGCPRCGLNRSAGERTYASLREALAHLWEPAVHAAGRGD